MNFGRKLPLHLGWISSHLSLRKRCYLLIFFSTLRVFLRFRFHLCDSHRALVACVGPLRLFWKINSVFYFFITRKNTIRTIIHLRIFVRSWLEHALRTQAIVRPAFASRLSRLLSLYVFLQMLRVWGFTWPKINKKNLITKPVTFLLFSLFSLFVLKVSAHGGWNRKVA